jgi:hypothetical protein
VSGIVPRVLGLTVLTLVVSLGNASYAGSGAMREDSLSPAKGTFSAVPDQTTAGSSHYPTVSLKVSCNAATCEVHAPKTVGKGAFLFTTAASNPLTLKRAKVGDLPSPQSYAAWDTLSPQSGGGSWGVQSRPLPPAPVKALWEFVGKPTYVRELQACYQGQDNASDPTQITGWIPCRGTFDVARESFVEPDGTLLNSQFDVLGFGQNATDATTRASARAVASRDRSPEFGTRAEFIRECKVRLHHGLALSMSGELNAIVWQTPVGRCPGTETDAALDASFFFKALVDTSWELKRT